MIRTFALCLLLGVGALAQTTTQSDQTSGTTTTTQDQTGTTGSTGQNSTVMTETRPGTLTGRVATAAGTLPSDLAIDIVNSSTGATQRIVPGPDGTFSATVPPGMYRIEIESGGRRRVARDNVEFVAGSNSRLDVTVQGAPFTEVVELKANAPNAQDDPPEIARGYGTRMVRSLPVFDRNYQELNGLMTGITPPVSNLGIVVDPQASRQFNTNGLPAWTNYNLMDGVMIKEPYTGTLSVRVLPDEAVRQMNIHESNYRAERGDAGGAITNVFMRPGTNGLHGSLFGFFSNDFLATRNPLNSTGTIGDPRLHHWQAGMSAGGSIVPDRTFLFGSYEWTSNHGSTTQIGSVPNAEMLTGNLSGLGTTIYNPTTGSTNTGAGRVPFANGAIPAGNISPVAAAILPYFPAPNLPGFANNYAANVPFGKDGHVFDVKLDHRLTDAFSGFLRYGFSSFTTNEGSLFGPVIGGADGSGLRNHHAAASVVGNYHGIVSEFRVGYNRYRNAITGAGLDTNLASQFAGLGFTNGVPSINISGIGNLGLGANYPQKDVDNSYLGNANFQVYKGMHQVRFGFDVQRHDSNGFNGMEFGPRGSFTFGPGATSLPGAAPSTSPNAVLANSFAAFLVGAPSQSGAFSFADVPTYRQTWYSAFVSDTIRATRRLAIDIGLRYDVYSPVSTFRSNGAAFYNVASNTLNYGSSLSDYDLNNVAPRFGFAFRPAERTVIRGSYSMSYFPIPFSLLGLNPVGAGVQTGLTGTYGITPFTSGALTLPAATTPVNGTAAPNFPFYAAGPSKTPYVQSYYMMLQQDIPGGFLFDAAYVGNIARELPYQRQLNAALPGTGIAGLPYFGYGRTAGVIENGTGLTSNFNSLQINLTKRLSKGVSFAVAYTFSKALDYGSGQLLNNFDTRANYGIADWDRRHMLTISHVFALPMGVGSAFANKGYLGRFLAGWEANGVFHWTSGAPYSIMADPLACGCPGTNSVMGVAQGPITINGQTTFDPTSFAAPTSGLGSLGRNQFRGPDSKVYNLALFKTFPIRDQFKLEFRGEAYNLFNSSLFGTPSSNVSYGNFGQNTTLMNNSAGRQFQVGARILF